MQTTMVYSSPSPFAVLGLTFLPPAQMAQADKLMESKIK
jgi:hypothetical protein